MYNGEKTGKSSQRSSTPFSPSDRWFSWVGPPSPPPPPPPPTVALLLFSTPPPPRSCPIITQPGVDVAGVPAGPRRVHVGGGVGGHPGAASFLGGVGQARSFRAEIESKACASKRWTGIHALLAFVQFRKLCTISCCCSARDQYYKDAAHGTGNMEK